MYLNVKDQLIRELSNSFEPKIKFDKRIKVLSDLNVFRPKEDVSVWKQSKGILPEYFVVYFDDEYICGFDASRSVSYAKLEFWKGFHVAYKQGKIYLDPNYKPEVVKKEKKKIKATTPTEKLAVEVIKKLES